MVTNGRPPGLIIRLRQLFTPPTSSNKYVFPTENGPIKSLSKSITLNLNILLPVQAEKK